MGRSALECASARVERFRGIEVGEKSRCLAVVPARGGSERIVGKNIVDFFGKPILAYTLEALGESGIFEEVHVSTDSVEIAEVAGRLGYAPLFLREAYMDGESGVWEVVRWVLECYRERGVEFDVVCMVSACAPLLEARDLCGGFAYFLSEEVPSPVIACCEYLSSPERALRLGMGGGLSPKWREKFLELRSQRLESLVMDSGAFAYMLASDALRFVRGGWGKELGRGYLLEREKGIDINTERDLEFAKLLYRARHKQT